MSDKRKNPKSGTRRERLRQRQFTDDSRRESRVAIPRGAVAADPSQQVPNNSYSPAPLFYMDKEFVCVDCGRKEVWTAQQQKWFYEVAKGSLYATAVRCRECRQIHSAQLQRQGDPNPIKHVGSLMKRIRLSIEPGLMAAGFDLEEKSYGKGSRTAWLDYSRPGLILRCLFDSRDARLVAETMDDIADCRIVANIELNGPYSTTALLERVDELATKVQEFVRGLPVMTAVPDGNDT